MKSFEFFQFFPTAVSGRAQFHQSLARVGAIILVTDKWRLLQILAPKTIIKEHSHCIRKLIYNPLPLISREYSKFDSYRQASTLDVDEPDVTWGRRLQSEDGHSFAKLWSTVNSMDQDHTFNEQWVLCKTVQGIWKDIHLLNNQSNEQTKLDLHARLNSATICAIIRATSIIKAYLERLIYTLVTDGPLENTEYIHSFPFGGPRIWLSSEDLEHGILNKWFKYTNNSLMIIHMTGLYICTCFRDNWMYFCQSISTSVS